MKKKKCKIKQNEKKKMQNKQNEKRYKCKQKRKQKNYEKKIKIALEIPIYVKLIMPQIDVIGSNGEGYKSKQWGTKIKVFQSRPNCVLKPLQKQSFQQNSSSFFTTPLIKRPLLRWSFYVVQKIKEYRDEKPLIEPTMWEVEIGFQFIKMSQSTSYLQQKKIQSTQQIFNISVKLRIYRYINLNKANRQKQIQKQKLNKILKRKKQINIEQNKQINQLTSFKQISQKQTNKLIIKINQKQTKKIIKYLLKNIYIEITKTKIVSITFNFMPFNILNLVVLS
ncbi:hypothetical protein TTHERM_00444730 (macronuclear) [Tetrahymena thermophila SB210]|uniref:Uncharacterized protein n=1 Tax=Tetrahymena thermophila (strain SB210) TaxID=312017 RepID=I7MHL8_TETTS|nr:hypothetical protein TTHERM_00444730 [Tetrahymena thermophila SB210]EAS03091.2 hypothetical protein TTHERM_00444730 [Tetrahymena thermophila SB210]|eukprot:XP_001023336.2 hypothetical protein TTHERM_00444730 [Tetrahymena thermophila SB210]